MIKPITLQKISQTMSFVLRHSPETFSIALDSGGWAKTSELAEALTVHFGELISVEKIDEVVAHDSKKRYAILGELIRASQGHSIPVDLELVPQVPPAILFHGTVEANIVSIMGTGLNSGSRIFVHLSESVETATQVAARYGIPVILEVNTIEATASGVEFFKSENNVWLASHVPAEFIKRS
jgi:putative RNA 2'-phosphotransferase